jgi:cytoskeletal protein CcmA (bactofilin family)
MAKEYSLFSGGLWIRKIFDLFARPAQPEEKREMADLTDDLGIPTKPSRTPTPSIMPRVVDNAGSSSGSPPGFLALPVETNSLTGSRPDQIERKTLIVGREISLSGHVGSCDRFVVEGSVEVTLNDCQHLEVAATGMFRGNASVENAEISGRFDGDLTVRKRLLIRASGWVSGTVTYEQIEIERGGKISGSLAVQEAKPILAVLPEPASARSR